MMNGISIRKKLGYKQEFTRTFLLPAVASLGMGAAAFVTYQGTNLLVTILGLVEKGQMRWATNCLCLIPAILVAVLVYFALVIKLGALNQKELTAMPKGRSLVQLAKKLRLL